MVSKIVHSRPVDPKTASAELFTLTLFSSLRRLSHSPVGAAVPFRIEYRSSLSLTVVTETWSSRYKSSIIDGKARRRIRRVGRRGAQSGESNILRLLALEGFEHENELEAKDLPTKLMDAVRGFHEHARYFMVGFPPSNASSTLTRVVH